MVRVIAGVILIIIGIYAGLEADNALDSTLVEWGAAITPNLEIPTWAIENQGNPIMSIFAWLGVDTFSEMKDCLSVVRIVSILLGIIGTMLIASKIYQRS